MSTTFAALAQTGAGGSSGGNKNKKKYKDMTPEERVEFVSKKREELVKFATEAHKDANATSRRGKRPVKMWEADANKLAKIVDSEGTLRLEYNHGTGDVPDLHPECYITPLCHTSKTNMMAGPGIKYVPKTDTAQVSKGPKDWSHMMTINIGLPYPSDIVDVNPAAVAERDKSLAYIDARADVFYTECATNPKVYPSLRSKETEAVSTARAQCKEDGREWSDAAALRAKKGYWRSAVKSGMEVVREKTANDEEGKYLFTELNLKSGSFFKQREGFPQKCPQEVEDVIATSNDEDKVRKAIVIRDAYAQGYELSKVHVDDLDEKPVECSIFSTPVRDNSLVVACITTTFYQEGILRGWTMHPMRIRIIRAPPRGAAHVDMETVLYAQRVKERTPLEIAVLKHLKVCTEADGLELVALIAALGDDVDSAKLTEAINTLAKDKLMSPGRTRTHFMLVDKMLNIDALPVVAAVAEDESDFAKVVAEARARLDKKRAEDAAAEAKRKEDEAAKEAARLKAAATASAVAANLPAAAAPPASAATPATAVTGAGAADSFARSMMDDDDDDDKTGADEPAPKMPAAKRQKTSK